jgi:hypothetical protein
MKATTRQEPEMPFKSRAQARMMFATHPRMAKEWASVTPSIKALPEKVKKSAVKWIGFFTELEKIARGQQLPPPGSTPPKSMLKKPTAKTTENVSQSRPSVNLFDPLFENIKGPQPRVVA